MAKQSLVKYLILSFLIGITYACIELLYRGRTHITMIPVGGLCGATIGLLNQNTNLKVWQQTVIGLPITLFIEFISGIYLNIYLKLAIWDYSNLWGNLYGQITPQFAILWVLLIPFGIWLDDYIRFKIFKEGYYYPIYENYVELALFK